MPKNQQVIGIVLLLVGLFVLLGETGVFALIGGKVWPFLMFLIGIVFYKLTRAALLPAVVMVPAGMLTIYGILFMASCWIHWKLFGLLWPLFLIGIGVGLYGYYTYDPFHPREIYRGALLFGGLGVAMLALMFALIIGAYMIAVILILIGVRLVYGKFRS